MWQNAGLVKQTMVFRKGFALCNQCKVKVGVAFWSACWAEATPTLLMETQRLWPWLHNKVLERLCFPKWFGQVLMSSISKKYIKKKSVEAVRWIKRWWLLLHQLFLIIAYSEEEKMFSPFLLLQMMTKVTNFEQPPSIHDANEKVDIWAFYVQVAALQW